ncbi:MAG TPA: hypothetical protein VIL01_00760 [Thermomicrobiales bacterium]|mgnify:CR=1 FL=1
MDASEGQIKRIVLERMHRCSVCHRPFAPEDVQILSRKPDVWMMVVHCTDCHSRSFVAALLGDGDPTAARMALRRLSREHGMMSGEFEAPAEPREPVTIDDVLDMHEFLKSFDGDFRKLFSQLDS